MKKLLFGALAALLTFSFCGCEGIVSFDKMFLIGSWRIEKMEMVMGNERQVLTYDDLGQEGTNSRLTFEENGVFVTSAEMYDEYYEAARGTWKMKGRELIVTYTADMDDLLTGRTLSYTILTLNQSYLVLRTTVTEQGITATGTSTYVRIP